MSKAPDPDLHVAPSYPRVKKDYIDLVHEIIRDEQPRAPGRTSRLLPFIVPLADMKYRGFGLKAMHKAANRAGIAVGYSSFVAWATRHLGTDSGKGSRAEAIVRKAVDDGAYESPGLVRRGEQAQGCTGAANGSTAESTGAGEVASNTCLSTSPGQKTGESRDTTSTSARADPAVSRARNGSGGQDSTDFISPADQAVSRARNERGGQDSTDFIPAADQAVSRARNEREGQDSTDFIPATDQVVSRARNEREGQDSTHFIPAADQAVSRARNEREGQDGTDFIPAADQAVSRARNESGGQDSTDSIAGEDQAVSRARNGSALYDNSSLGQTSAPESETISQKEVLQRRLDILDAASQKLKSPLERRQDRALTNP